MIELFKSEKNRTYYYDKKTRSIFYLKDNQNMGLFYGIGLFLIIIINSYWRYFAFDSTILKILLIIVFDGVTIGFSKLYSGRFYRNRTYEAMSDEDILKRSEDIKSRWLTLRIVMVIGILAIIFGIYMTFFRAYGELAGLVIQALGFYSLCDLNMRGFYKRNEFPWKIASPEE